MADWTSLRYAVADVEGNGQRPPDLVELAVLPITDGVIGEPVSWLVKPSRPITSFATSIHGISGKDVASAPAFADIEHEVRRALADRVLVAHNAHRDPGGPCAIAHLKVPSARGGQNPWKSPILPGKRHFFMQTNGFGQFPAQARSY